MAQGQLPNLIIAGVHKAGSTSLFTWLGWHPHIATSSKKELHYFTPIRYGGQPAPLAEYSSYFSANAAAKWYVEASPSYMYGGEALARQLDETLPNAHVIVLLREPAARFVSFYKHLQSNLAIPQNESFAEFYQQSLQYVDVERIEDEYHQRGLREGFYANYLPAWFDRFGDRLQIVFFETLVGDPFNSLSHLCNWLQLDAEPYANRDFSAENKTTHYSNRALHQLAVGANRALEPLLRKSHGLKKGIRSLYYKVNKGKLQQQITEAQKQEVRALYASSNRELKKLMREKGYHNLPDWLANA